MLIFAVLSLRLNANATLPHDFHVSITTIDCNPKTGALEITVKIFTDDLEKSILKLGGPELKVGANDEAKDTDSFIEKYLQNRLFIEANGKTMSPKWIGKEVEIDATWCYLEVPNVGKLEEIKITNRILLEIFDDQSNLVHIHCGTDPKSLYLRKGNEAEFVKID